MLTENLTMEEIANVRYEEGLEYGWEGGLEYGREEERKYILELMEQGLSADEIKRRLTL
jgi:flagellar biosynthesis/type III secretory pathway protein FliH